MKCRFERKNPYARLILFQRDHVELTLTITRQTNSVRNFFIKTYARKQRTFVRTPSLPKKRTGAAFQFRAPCSVIRASYRSMLPPKPFSVRSAPIRMTLFRFTEQHAEANAGFAVSLVAELMQTK
jgi:hypothetical protein